MVRLMPKSYATTREGRVVAARDVGLGRRDGGDEVDAVGAAGALRRGADRRLVGAERARERALSRR